MTTGHKLSLGLFTDLYELTMAQAYWQSGMTAEGTFSLFFRNYPPNRGYFVFAGLEDVLDYLEGFGFSEDDIAFLESLERFDEDFLGFLSELRFTGSVRAMPEGNIFFANEPVIEVTAPVIEAQLVETFLVNQVNIQTILATKASRVVHAAQGKTLVDFAARRTHGYDSANSLARSAYMTGFTGTSNVLAGGLYGIPLFGTIAHSLITAFENEIDSFRAYAKSFPDSVTLLVDTYDTLEGTKKAIEVAQEMKKEGHDLRAIRLDSGDFLSLSKDARALLDEAGLNDVQVFASGGIDEFAIQELLEQDAPIDGFGIGTKVGVSADAPWTDCAYKLVQYDNRPVMKLSNDKVSAPGPKQVWRLRNEDGTYGQDAVTRAIESPPNDQCKPLLEEVMSGGEILHPHPSLLELRDNFQKEFASLPDEYKALESPKEYLVETSRELDLLQDSVVERIEEHENISAEHSEHHH